MNTRNLTPEQQIQHKQMMQGILASIANFKDSSDSRDHGRATSAGIARARARRTLELMRLDERFRIAREQKGGLLGHIRLVAELGMRGGATPRLAFEHIAMVAAILAGEKGQPD